MKRIIGISLLSFLFSINILIAQASYPPVVNHSDWAVETGMIAPYDYYITYSRDTTISFVTYQIFVDHSYTSVFEYLIREDLPNKKVYKLVNNVDVLLFDFSLSFGDYITLSNGSSYQVVQEDSVVVMNSQKRRRLKLLTTPTPFSYFDETWIEGMGNPNHPLIANYDRLQDPDYKVLCSFQNGLNIYNEGQVNVGTPIICPTFSPTNVKSIETKNTISISPNPFHNFSVLKSSLSLKNAVLTISNSLGQILKEINNINGNQVLIYQDNLPIGIYFLNLSQNNLILYNQKLIFN